MRFVSAVLVFLAMAVSVAFGGVDGKNWSTRTFSISVLGTASCTTAAMNFSQYDKVGAVVLANDTGVALFANDSISLQIKYQTGVVVLNSSGAVDTAWRNQVIMDTMLTDSLGKQVNKNVVTAGTMVETFKMGRTDTLSVTGYAALTIPPIAAPQAECIRFIVTGLGANSAVGGSVVGKLVACLRPFAPVQDK